MPTEKTEKFEDVKAWQNARTLVQMVYHMSGQRGFGQDVALRDQVRRAAGSTMHYIAMGFDAGSDAEFARFLGRARRSAAEVQSVLYIALDQEYIYESEFQTIYVKAAQVKKLINDLIARLGQSSP